jgi:hypothetical protein
VEDVDQTQTDQQIEVGGFQADALTDIDGPTDAIIEFDYRCRHFLLRIRRTVAEVDEDVAQCTYRRDTLPHCALSAFGGANGCPPFFRLRMEGDEEHFVLSKVNGLDREAPRRLLVGCGSAGHQSIPSAAR